MQIQDTLVLGVRLNLTQYGVRRGAKTKKKRMEGDEPRSNCFVLYFISHHCNNSFLRTNAHTSFDIRINNREIEFQKKEGYELKSKRGLGQKKKTTESGLRIKIGFDKEKKKGALGKERDQKKECDLGKEKENK